MYTENLWHTTNNQDKNTKMRLYLSRERMSELDSVRKSLDTSMHSLDSL